MNWFECKISYEKMMEIRIPKMAITYHVKMVTDGSR
ncbi:DUF4494 domain-containing protein [Dysgonomonas sp. 521]|nr:DUF4494 domain-containing protein [Dysgonomonas sp. 521]